MNRLELHRFFSGFRQEDLMKFIPEQEIPKLIPPLQTDISSTLSFLITNDPVYIAGMGTFALNFTNAYTFKYRGASGQPRPYRGVVYFINHPGVSVALLVAKCPVFYNNVKRMQILASSILYFTKTAILFSKIYSEDRYRLFFYKLLIKVGIMPIDWRPNHTPVLGSFKIPLPEMSQRFPVPHLDYVSLDNYLEEKDSKSLVTKLRTDYLDATGKSRYLALSYEREN